MKLNGWHSTVRGQVTRRRLIAFGAVAAVAGLVVTLAPATATQQEQSGPTHPATAGALPTPQTDGVVFDVEIIGDVAYAGGRFSKARPAGVAPGGDGEVTRHNLLAFNVHTGELLPWAPQVQGSEFTSDTDPGGYCKTISWRRYVCDSVFELASSPQGSRLYVGGDFDRIDGRWHSRIAKFNADTGALMNSFKPMFSSRVRGISVTPDAVYVGGSFKSVVEGGTSFPRTRLAAVTPGGEVTDWAPTADRTVFAVLASPEHDRVVVGGAFDKLNGSSSQRKMGAVSLSTGQNVPWAADVGEGSPTITAIVTDGSGKAFISAYDAVGGVGKTRFEGRMSADIATGEAQWWDGCLGDTQDIAVAGGVVYAASHTHDCEAIGAIPERGAHIRHFRLNAETTEATRTAPSDYGRVAEGDPIPDLLPWFPNTNGGPSDSEWHNGPWAVDASSEYVVYGGEFTKVNGERQQSLTRFAARGVDGAVNRGPRWPFRAPELSKDGDGKVVVRWQTTWDAQNGEVTYQIVKIGTGVIHEVTQESRPWDLPWLEHTTDVESGSFYLRAIDADGVRIGSPQAHI